LWTRGKEGSIFRDFVGTSFIDDLLLFVYCFGLKLNEITQESRQGEWDLPILNVKERGFFI